MAAKGVMSCRHQVTKRGFNVSLGSDGRLCEDVSDEVAATLSHTDDEHVPDDERRHRLMAAG